MTSERPKSKPPETKSRPPEPQRTASGTMKVVHAMRKKLDSIDENTMPILEEALEAAKQTLATLPPASDNAPETPAVVVIFEEKKTDE